jgi:hypothetical protein
VEIRDSSDHRGAGDELVAVARELGEELRVFGVALDETVARVVVEAALERTVLGVVVDADDLVAGVEQVGDEIPGNKPGSAGDENSQSRMGPVIPQMSTTSRPARSSFL